MKRLIALIIFTALMFSGCSLFIAKMPDPASRITGLNLDACTEVSVYDDHGGFLGDGMSFCSYTFEDNDIENQIAKDEHWTSSPSEMLLAKFYGDEETSCAFADEDDNPLFPITDNGYYFFYDRHSEATDPYDLSALHENRYSYNYSLALFDCNTNTLYYAEYDT